MSNYFAILHVSSDLTAGNLQPVKLPSTVSARTSLVLPLVGNRNVPWRLSISVSFVFKPFWGDYKGPLDIVASLDRGTDAELRLLRCCRQCQVSSRYTKCYKEPLVRGFQHVEGIAIGNAVCRGETLRVEYQDYVWGDFPPCPDTNHTSRPYILLETKFKDLVEERCASRFEVTATFNGNDSQLGYIAGLQHLATNSQGRSKHRRSVALMTFDELDRECGRGELLHPARCLGSWT
jgi:hypothetical protein